MGTSKTKTQTQIMGTSDSNPLADTGPVIPVSIASGETLGLMKGPYTLVGGEYRGLSVCYGVMMLCVMEDFK